jgi:hypothetical protein
MEQHHQQEQHRAAALVAQKVVVRVPAQQVAYNSLIGNKLNNKYSNNYRIKEWH